MFSLCLYKSAAEAIAIIADGIHTLYMTPTVTGTIKAIEIGAKHI